MVRKRSSAFLVTVFENYIFEFYKFVKNLLNRYLYGYTALDTAQGETCVKTGKKVMQLTC